MSTTIGTAQSIITLTTNAVTSQQFYYFTKFVSEPLNQTSIAANTWTYNFAARSPVSGFANYPTGSTNQPVRVHVYVWRPSNGTKVGTILDGTSASTVDECVSSSLLVCQTTFSGAAVSSIQTNDVIICEIWHVLTQSLGSAVACEFAYDGTTANTTKNATVTNHASFLETPENISFVGATTPVSQTSIHKYSIRQYIAQTSIQKYSIRQYLLQTSIQKYNLLKNLLQTSIQKYAIRKAVIQTTIQKYNIFAILVLMQTSIHKYNLRKNILQASIHKYNLRRFVPTTTNIQKYAILKALIQTSIHKYNLRKAIIQTTIQKYSLGGVLLLISRQKYHILRFVAVLTNIHKYAIRKNVAATTSIQKYSVKKFVTQTTIHKYNNAGGVLPPIDMTQANVKTYSNKFIVKV
jgi:hypothetical protein